MSELNGHPIAAVGDLCRLVNGRAFKPTEWTTEGLPIIRIQNLNDETKPFNYFDGEYKEQHEVNDGDLLFSWSGTPGTSFGAFFWNRGRGVLNQHIYNVRIDYDRIEKRYFRYALNSRLSEIIGHAHGGVGLKHITKGKLEAINLTVPTLSEQKRIADILDKANAIRRSSSRRWALFNEVERSTFMELFGNPVTNSKRWCRKQLGSVLSGIESGWSPSCLDRHVNDGEWGILKLGAVTGCEYAASENKALPKNQKPRPEIEVKRGDVLMSRKNTYELVAATAYVHDTRPKLMLPDLVFRLQIARTDLLLPQYLWGLFTEPSKRRQIQRLASGSSGSMPNISKSRLNNLVIEIPDIEFQQQFASVVDKVHLARQQERARETDISALFNSLVQRAFKGEL